MTFSAPVFVRAAFKNENTGEIKEQTVFMGDFPMMTEKGTFFINGSERVIVSQLHRSPSATFNEEIHTSGHKLFVAKIVPYRGAWIEFEYDIKDQIYPQFDQVLKIPEILIFLLLLQLQN